MAHRPADVREPLTRECSFPADRETVAEAVGEVEIAASDGESVTVETVLARSEETSFASPTELHTTILANLDDDHVGRTEYDDRSANPTREENRSF
jgi:hypothetical protein